MRTLKIDELELVAGAGDHVCTKDCPEERVKGNNGFGNGDQAAPGNSLNNNGAENSPNPASGKPSNPQ